MDGFLNNGLLFVLEEDASKMIICLHENPHESRYLES